MFFIYLSSLICVVTVCYFLLLKKHFFYLPSFLFFFFFIVRVQIPSVFSYDYLYEYSNIFFIYSIIVFLFPLSFIINFYIFNTSCKKIYKKQKFSKYAFSLKKTLLLFSLVIMLLIIYFNQVSFYNTGLYHFFASPSLVKETRETSLKLLESKFTLYGFSILRSSIIPVLILTLCYKSHFLKKISITYVTLILIILVLSFITFIPGNRSSLLYILLLIICFNYFKNGFRYNFFKIFLQLFIFFLIPVIIVIRINEVDINLDNLYYFWTYGIYDRVFFSPGIKVGSWWLDYVNNNGFVGIGGIPKIATLFNVAPLDMPNIIGLNYVTNAIESINASCCQLFTFYSYFGYSGLLITFLFFLILDYFVIKFYALIKPSLYIVLASLVFLIMVHSTETELLTLLFTHGLLPSIILIYYISLKYKY